MKEYDMSNYVEYLGEDLDFEPDLVVVEEDPWVSPSSSPAVALDPDASSSPEDLMELSGSADAESSTLVPYDDTQLLEQLQQIHEDLFLIAAILLITLVRLFVIRYKSNFVR